METYLAALVSYYLKPRTRRWTPGQRESTILITAPKIVEDTRTRDLSEEEAGRRLSFLADIVDTQGYAIKGFANNNMRDDLVAEANATADMFDDYKMGSITRAIDKDEHDRHEELISSMRAAIERNEAERWGSAEVIKDSSVTSVAGQKVVAPPQKANANSEQKPAKDSIIELANNPDYSVETIAKEANRIKRKDEGEVFISLH